MFKQEGLKINNSHLVDALKTKDLIILEYILSNFKTTKQAFNSDDSTYLKYILMGNLTSSLNITSSERCSDEYKANAVDLFNIYKILFL